MTPASHSTRESLLMLSDLHGLSMETYMAVYLQRLEPYYEVEVIDTPELAGVPTYGRAESQIHTDILATGADSAVEKLLARQSVTGILAFSMGGWVAWKAMLQGLKVDRLVAVSATRLRYEENWPEQGSIHLVYGGDDPYRPKQYWPKAKNITVEVLLGEPHTLYKNEALADRLTRPFLES